MAKKLGIEKPIFKNKQNITYNYLNSSFEIFKLKNVNNAFYIAFSTIEKTSLNIYKYDYKTKKYELIQYIKELNYSDKLIKYFYNPCNNNEYLYILISGTIYIYLIVNEKKYELIKKIIATQDVYYSFYSINYFDIIYNVYNKNIYLITSSNYWNNQHYIEITKYNEKKSDIVFSFSFKDNDNFFKKKFLIYKDVYNNKYYLITKKNYLPQMIEIKDKYDYYNEDKNFENIYTSRDQLKKLNIFYNNSTNKYIDIIYGNDSDYLYISNREGNIIIIDLIKKEINKEFKINYGILSFLYFNIKYILFVTENSILIYDICLNKIITKYSNIFENEKINYIKTHSNNENNFHCLFICGNKTIDYYIMEN